MTAARLSWTLAGVAIRQRVCRFRGHRWTPWFDVLEDDDTTSRNRVCRRCVAWEAVDSDAAAASEA